MEADRQGGEITTSEAARSMAPEVQCRRTACDALCIFDSTSKIFQF
jgi:hypothetical protein